MAILRKTKSVKTVLDFFESTDNGISAVELIEQLTDRMNKTTVYRILDRLENEGMIHSFMGNDGLRWFAKCHDCDALCHKDLHPHFQCKVCGKTECLDLTISIPNVENYQIDAAELLLTGICKDCLTDGLY